MITIRTKLPTHEHPLYPSPWVRRCDGCNDEWDREDGYSKDGYRCYECRMFFHKECAESSLEINHPSHSEHPLQLSFNKYAGCKLCGKEVKYIFYHCPICDFVVDTACARNPPPDVIKYPKAHEHSLVILKNVYDGICELCEVVLPRRYLYKCFQCQLAFHFECSKIPREINYACHPKHPIKLFTREEHHFSDGRCHICGKELRDKFYYCSICKFSVDIGCVRNPPPPTIEFAKAHEHQLNFMLKKISFICDACGLNGSESPYSCHQCDFMIHQTCIDLPEIINVNRHDHRLERRPHLSHGNWICNVCYQKVDWSYGAYSCLVCPNYAIHSTCAIRYDVWDKLELKGIPEETQNTKPFKVIHENLICHFSHEEHYLNLNEENIVCGGSIRCAACVFPIYSQPFYSCVICDFVLHKTCANLPRKKRHVCHDKLLTLFGGDMKIFWCPMCCNYSSGFKYTSSSGGQIDVTCSALSESIIHECHPCPLYFKDETGKICVVCGDYSTPIFSCEDCNFVLDTRCVVLPKTTKHWYDEHLLSIRYEKNTSEKYWCDICEETLGTKTWFYACDNCCVNFHIECVLGDFSLIMPGRLITYNDDWRFEVMQTNPGFLPRCYTCRSRKAVPSVLKVFYAKKIMFFCSAGCFSTHYGPLLFYINIEMIGDLE